MKKLFNNSRHMDLYLSLLITGVGTIVLAVFFDVWYTINDDVMLKDILSGAYTGTPDGHCVQMLYPLGFLISSLYRLIPAWNWFGLFMCFYHMLCAFLIIYRLLTMAESRRGKLLSAFLGVLGLIAILLGKFIYIQYTVTSGILAATAIFWFVTTPDQHSARDFNKENIIAMILYILASCMRLEMGLILLPLVAAAGIYKWSAGAKRVGLKFFCAENYRKYLITVLVVLLGMGLSVLCDQIAYGSEEWKAYRTFDDTRTELYDFRGRAPEYEGNEGFYDAIGMSAEEVELLVNYNYALDENIDTELILAIMDYEQEEKGVGYFRYSLSDAFVYYRWQTLHLVDRPWMIVIAAGYFLVLAAGLLNGHFAILWQLLLLGVMRTVSWMYIFLRGRFYDRVNHPVYLCEMLILMAMLLMELRQLCLDYRKPADGQKQDASPLCAPETTGQVGTACRKMQESAARICQILRDKCGTAFKGFTVLVLAIIFGIYSVIAVRDAFTDKAEMEAEYEACYQPLQEYCAAHLDSYFLIDVYSFTTAFEPVFTAGDSVYRNYDLCGGWAAKSPVYAQKLASAGIEDLAADLADLDNVYFISKDSREIDWLAAWYAVKGYTVEVTAVDHIDVEEDEGYTIYAVSYAGN
ncbi:MAG: hypothetical protein LUI10_10570 [Lachnospiraceae bacterium]|nr:hypothetical protein [Lachnospiraceae bacterium]